MAVFFMSSRTRAPKINFPACDFHHISTDVHINHSVIWRLGRTKAARGLSLPTSNRKPWLGFLRTASIHPALGHGVDAPISIPWRHKSNLGTVHPRLGGPHLTLGPVREEPSHCLARRWASPSAPRPETGADRRDSCVYHVRDPRAGCGGKAGGPGCRRTGPGEICYCRGDN